MRKIARVLRKAPSYSPAHVRKGKAEILFACSVFLFFSVLPFVVKGRSVNGDVFGLGQPELFAGLNPVEAGVPDPSKNVLSFVPYRVVSGDTISEIAERYGLNQDSIISCNDIEKARHLQIGALLQIPNMDGLMHTVRNEDSLEKIAERYQSPLEHILQANNLASLDDARGRKIFIPEARLPAIELRRVWGELFRYPARGWISSAYGYREDPVYGGKRFHNGIDIANVTGTPVVAALEGTVADTGYNESAGNYVVISHAGGYATLYAHLDKILTRPGLRVNEWQKIGEMGSTGYSTGSHVHFSIFRWGRPINPALLLH